MSSMSSSLAWAGQARATVPNRTVARVTLSMRISLQGRLDSLTQKEYLPFGLFIGRQQGSVASSRASPSHGRLREDLPEGTTSPGSKSYKHLKRTSSCMQ